jgi:hypothetical protein
MLQEEPNERTNWHGILLDAAFTEPGIITQFNCLAERVIEDWRIFCVEIPAQSFERDLLRLQAAMRPEEPFYLHFYRGDLLVVVFAGAKFEMTRDRESWADAVAYGSSINIPFEQLDFIPNDELSESEYFSRE